MQKIESFIIRIANPQCACNFYEAEKSDFFCIEIPDDAIRGYVYDHLMIALDGFEIAEEKTAYIKAVYAHYGVPRMFTEFCIEENGKSKKYSFTFDPQDQKENHMATIIDNEFSGQEKEDIDLFPPAILLEEEFIILKNVLEHIKSATLGKNSLILDGEKMPDNLLDDLQKYRKGLVNITSKFDPIKWGLTEYNELIDWQSQNRGNRRTQND